MLCILPFPILDIDVNFMTELIDNEVVPLQGTKIMTTVPITNQTTYTIDGRMSEDGEVDAGCVSHTSNGVGWGGGRFPQGIGVLIATDSPGSDFSSPKWQNEVRGLEVKIRRRQDFRGGIVLLDQSTNLAKYGDISWTLRWTPGVDFARWVWSRKSMSLYGYPLPV